MSYVVALLALVVVALVVLVIGLLRSHAEVLKALHDMGVYLDGRPVPTAGEAVPQPAPTHLRNTPAPSHLSGTDPSGEALVVPLDGAGPTLLMCLTTGCTSCHAFWDALATKEVPGFRTVIVTRGADSESPDAVAALAPRSVTTLMSTEAWTELSVPGAPYFVHVEDGKVVGEGVAHGWDALLGLLGRAEGDARRRKERSRRLTRREVLSPGAVAAAQRADRELPADGGEGW